MITVNELQVALAQAANQVNEANAKIDALGAQIDKNTSETRTLISMVEDLNAKLEAAQMTLPDDVATSLNALTEATARVSSYAAVAKDKLTLQDELVKD